MRLRNHHKHLQIKLMYNILSPIAYCCGIIFMKQLPHCSCSKLICSCHRTSVCSWQSSPGTPIGLVPLHFQKAPDEKKQAMVLSRKFPLKMGNFCILKMYPQKISNITSRINPAFSVIKTLKAYQVKEGAIINAALSLFLY